MLKSLAYFIFIAGVFSRMILSRQAAKVAKKIIPKESLRPSRLCESLINCEIFFSRQAAKIAKPCVPQRSLCALRAFARASLIAGYFFLAKPPRSLSPAYPSGAFAFFAPLRENNYYLRESFSLSRQDRKDLYTPAEPLRPPRLCEILINRGIFFSRQAAKIAKPCVPQRSLCVLRAFARE